MQDAADPSSQVPLTTAPARAGSIVTVTAAFQKFLLSGVLLLANETTVTLSLDAGCARTMMDVLPVKPPESVMDLVMVRFQQQHQKQPQRQ